MSDDDESGVGMAAFAGNGRVGITTTVKAFTGSKKRINPYYLALDCMATLVAVFFLSTAATLSRALAFGDDWIGMCAIAGVSAATYLLVSVATGGSIAPHFDIITILLSLRIFNIKSFRKDNIKHVPSGSEQLINAVEVCKGQYCYNLSLTEGFWLIVAVMAGAFASAGICRLVLDSAYDNAEIVIRDSNFNSGEAFFVELFGYVFINFLLLQLPLNGVHPAITSIVLGLTVLGFQALGFNVSSACYNFTRWLSVNAVGGASAWSSDSWLWPVAGVVAVVSIAVISAIMNWLRIKGKRYNNKYEST